MFGLGFSLPRVFGIGSTLSCAREGQATGGNQTPSLISSLLPLNGAFSELAAGRTPLDTLKPAYLDPASYTTEATGGFITLVDIRFRINGTEGFDGSAPVVEGDEVVAIIAVSDNIGHAAEFMTDPELAGPLSLKLVANSDHTASIQWEGESFQAMILQPSRFSGAAVSVTRPALAAGPISLHAPVYAGSSQIGGSLSVEDHLFVYDASGPIPAVIYRHQKDSGGGYADIGGATAQTYDVQAVDLGAVLRGGVSADGGTTWINTGPVTVTAAAGLVLRDDFDRADETLTDNAAWSGLSGSADIAISGGQVVQPTVGVSEVISSVDLTDDQAAQIDVLTFAATGTADHVRLYLRYGDAGNYYWAYWRGDNRIRIGKVASGLSSTLVTSGPRGGSPTSGTFRFEAAGTVLRACVDDVEIISTSDTSHSSGKAGLGIQRDSGSSAISDIALDSFRSGASA